MPHASELYRTCSDTIADYLEEVLGPAGHDPAAAVFATRVLRDCADAWLDVEVRHARQDGATWEQIGDALGTTRQSAHERFRHVEQQSTEPAG